MTFVSQENPVNILTKYPNTFHLTLLMRFCVAFLQTGMQGWLTRKTIISPHTPLWHSPEDVQQQQQEIDSQETDAFIC